MQKTIYVVNPTTSTRLSKKDTLGMALSVAVFARKKNLSPVEPHIFSKPPRLQSTKVGVPAEHEV